MQVVILAAGVGSRLRPITNDKPKCLVKVCGESILKRQIESYLAAGLREKDVSIVVGYKGEQIKEFCSKKFPGVKIIENKKFLTTNNMYSLFLYLNKTFFDLTTKQSLVLSNGDCVYDPSIVLDIVREEGDLIACDSSFFLNESMKVVATKDKKLIQISKEVLKKDAFATSIDLYKFSYNSVLKLYMIIDNYIKNKEFNKWTEVAIDKLIKIVNVYPLNVAKRKWAEIDDLKDLYYGEKIFSRPSHRINKKYS